MNGAERATRPATRVRIPRRAATLLVPAALAYCGLFAANSLVRVRAFPADAMNYVDVARRIAAGDGLAQSTGGFNQPFWLSGDLDLPAAFTAQPPGWPLSIAAVAGLGIDAADAALAVSAASYAAILALVWLLGRRIAGAPAGAAALGGALLFAPLAHLGHSALSECLAVAAALLFLLLLDRHLERRRVDRFRADPPRRAGFAAFGLGLLAGAASGVRYALWPLPLLGGAALWWSGREGRGEAARRRESAAFAAGALAPITAILARHLAIEGSLPPAAMPAARSLGENVGLAVKALFGGWRSTALGNWPDAVLFAAGLSILALLAVRGDRRPRPRRLPLLLGAWAVLYLGALVWAGARAHFDPIGARLALPATVPLIPLYGALLAGAMPRARRFAWLPTAFLVLCASAAFAREAALWRGGLDARALEVGSERRQWLRNHAGPGDLVVGGGAMDVPFLFPGRFAISYAGLPYTEVLTYAGLQRIAGRHCPDFDRILLVVRPTVLLGGGRSGEDPADRVGRFVADARAGRHEAWPLLRPLAAMKEARVYEVACPRTVSRLRAGGDARFPPRPPDPSVPGCRCRP